MTFQTLALDLERVVGSGGVLTERSDIAGFGEEETGRFGRTAPTMVIRPRSEAQLSAALRMLAGASLDYVVTPSSGRTSLKGGCVPVAGLRGDPLRVSVDFSRLTAISVDADTGRVIASAGCTLEAVDAAAASMGRAFGVRIGPQAIAQVGGSVAIGTTAGDRAARKGTVADQIPGNGTGLRAMLINGSIVTTSADLPSQLRGYGLRRLFSGTEGAFGLVLGATFNTWPRLTHRSAAILDVESVDQAVRIAELLHEQPIIESLELMMGDNLQFVCAEGKLPTPRTNSAVKLLVEAASVSDPTEELQEIIGALLEDGLITDADGPSETEADREYLWNYRKWFPVACNHNPPVLKFDVRVAYKVTGKNGAETAAYAKFVEKVTGLIQGICPNAHVIIFGHLLGKNLHINVLGAAEPYFEAIEDVVFGLLLEYGGEISHEHGYGQALCERRWSLLAEEAREGDLMVKNLLDPQWRLNRGIWIPAHLAPR